MNRRLFFGTTVFGAFLVASISTGISGAGLTQAQEASKGEAQGGTVEVTIDYGDGAQRRYQLPFRQGDTILQVLDAVQKHPRGVPFKYRGKAETAFLTEIDGVVNEGRGRNWLYRVNGLKGEESFAVYRLAAGAQIVWKYQSFQDKP